MPDAAWSDYVLTANDLPILETTRLIAECNPTKTYDRVIELIMSCYWRSDLPLYRLNAPQGNSYGRDKHDNVFRTGEEVGVVVGDRRRYEISRHELLYILDLLFHFDPEYRANEVGYLAVAKLPARDAYGCYLEGLGNLHADTAALADCCREVGLEWPPQLPRGGGNEMAAAPPQAEVASGAGVAGRVPLEARTLMSAALERLKNQGTTWRSNTEGHDHLIEWLKGTHPGMDVPARTTVASWFRGQIPVKRR